MRYLRLGAVLVYSLLIVHSLLFIVFADEGISKAEAAKQKPATGKKAFFAELKDKVKITGSLYEYFIYQKNVYFNRDKKDSFLETTARVGAKVSPFENLDFDFGLIGEQVAGDANEYTILKNHDLITKLEFANFTAKKLFDLPLDIIVGRQNIEFGDGLLIYDFYSDKGAVWTGSMRSLYAFRAIANPNPELTIDVFSGQVDKSFLSYETYLKDLTTYRGIRNVSGANVHYDAKKLGLWDFGLFYKYDKSLLKSNTLAASIRSSYNVPFLTPLTLEGELVPEWGTTKAKDGALSDTKQRRRAVGGHLDVIYSFKEKLFSPYLKAGYCYFPGDNPNTKRNVAFDPLFYGFRDWGKWFIGSINGFNLFHTNQRTAFFEAGMSPTKATLLRLMYYDLSLDRENNADSGKRFSREVNLIFDWFPNDYFFCGAEFGFAHPLKAGRAYAGSDDNTMEVVSWMGLKF